MSERTREERQAMPPTMTRMRFGLGWMLLMPQTMLGDDNIHRDMTRLYVNDRRRLRDLPEDDHGGDAA